MKAREAPGASHRLRHALGRSRVSFQQTFRCSSSQTLVVITSRRFSLSGHEPSYNANVLGTIVTIGGVAGLLLFG